MPSSADANCPSRAAFRYDTVPGSRDYNSNPYASGPSNPFGSFSGDGEPTTYRNFDELMAAKKE